RAADAYDPAAADSLAQVYELIADCEMKLNRPVAARAAMQVSLHLRPDNEPLREALDGYFGPESRLPAWPRRADTLVTPPAGRTPGGSTPSSARRRASAPAAGPPGTGRWPGCPRG